MPETIGSVAATREEIRLPKVLSELADFNLHRFGEYSFLYYEGQTYTNAEIADQARRLAVGLRTQGVQQGDRVVVMLVNSPAVIVAYQAVARIGGVIVPLLPVLKTPEIQHIVNNCEPRAIIANLPLVSVVQPALDAAELPHPVTIIAVGEADQVKEANLVSYSELIANNEPQSETAQVQPGDLAIILYTSGTTGKPKGVMLSHNNQMANLMAVCNMEVLVSGAMPTPEPQLIALPLAHAFGLTTSNLSYLSNNPIVLMSRFETQKALELIEKYQVHHIPAAPAMLVAMLNYPDAEKYDTSSLVYVVSGSAPLPENILTGFEKRFGATIREGYGLTEANTSVSGHPQEIGIKPGSVGIPHKGNQVRIADAEGNTLPPNERGEVQVRGDNVMMGYYKNPQATADAIVDGWLRTGDFGYMDEDGYLYIVERIKDLIIRGGQNVYPRDSEEVLGQHPAVLEVAVVGIPSEKFGEEVKAFVVLKPGQTATEDELIAHTQKYLANYKTPAYIEFIEALPRNTVGKINKRALRQMSAPSR